MNKCYYTKSIIIIKNKINYSYKYTNTQYMNNSDYTILNIY